MLQKRSSYSLYWTWLRRTFTQPRKWNTQHQVQVLDHCGDFGKAMRELFYANNKLVYQLLHPPEILLSHSKACNGSFCYCKIKYNSSSAHGQDEHSKMREWASEHGQCVRQLTVRQQTTKFSAGILSMSVCLGYKPTNVGRRSHWKRGTGSRRRIWLWLWFQFIFASTIWEWGDGEWCCGAFNLENATWQTDKSSG